MGGIEGLLGAGTPAAEAQTSQPQYVVMIVLDAFRPDYMNLAPMPNLSRLMASGTVYDNAWVGQLESETPTGHASLSTGAYPRHDGVLGFEWRDPITGKEALDGWPPAVLSGQLEEDLRASGANSLPLAFKAANPASRVVAISSEKVYAADALGGWAADYILYHQRTGPKKEFLVPGAVPGHAPPADFFHAPHLTAHLPMKLFSQWDYLSAMLAINAVAHFKPRLLMVNLPGADVYGHPYGGPATPSVFRQVAVGLDNNIGRIVDAYKSAGIYDQTLFVVTADHGMVPNDRAVDGAITKAAIAAAGGQYLFHTGGTAAYIYLKNPTSSPNVAKKMATIPGVVTAYYRTSLTGDYQRVPGSLDSTLDAAYRYMIDTFVGDTSPDVIAPFHENTIGTKASTAHGDHGGTNWGAQHIPLVLSGPGVRPGAVSHHPARLVDVAPTILRLMNYPVTDMDGAVLADAFIEPAVQDTVSQTSLARLLSPLQSALTGQAQEDIAQDQKLGLKPPPSAPARP